MHLRGMRRRQRGNISGKTEGNIQPTNEWKICLNNAPDIKHYPALDRQREGEKWWFTKWNARQRMEITSPTAEINSGYFSSEAYAGLGCDSCGNTNDTQIKLPSAIHLEKCTKLKMHSAWQETRPTELLLMSAANLRPAANSLRAVTSI